jgi:short-subunit dehydrogenase
MDANAIGAAVLAILVLVNARRLAWLLSGPWCDYATHVQILPADAFEGKVCWVTGASGGIGAGLAHALASRGASLILSARRVDALNAVASALPCPPERVHVLAVDLGAATAEELRAVAAEAAAAFGGRLDYLFNNAGVSSRAVARNFHPANLEAILRLNFVAPALLTQACLPALERARGVVVNTSSIAAIIFVPLRSSYCASKAALSAWHESLRYEELGRVSVVNVCPGSVRTNVARNAFVSLEKQRRQSSDVNIENGLDVSYTAERMVAAAYGRLQNSWIAKSKELLATYAFFYFPALWPRMAPLLAQKYMAEIERSSAVSK